MSANTVKSNVQEPPADVLAEPDFIIVSTFGKPNVVERKFMNGIHEVCRDLEYSSRLERNINHKLRKYHSERRFLPAGFIRNFSLKFTHLQYGKDKNDITLDSNKSTGLIFAPWAKAGYIPVFYQHSGFDESEIRLPVALDIDIYPEERIVNCAGSWQSPIKCEPPDEEYTLQEVLNALQYIQMISVYKPEYGYRKLHENEIILFPIWG